ncbi:MAG: hypothetical protein KBG24_09265 [Bacteroidia bacterium]|nr:hypothetical protein [Bacteroidia bacterium]
MSIFMAIVPFVSYGFLMEFSSERVLYLTDTTLMTTTDSLKTKSVKISGSLSSESVVSDARLPYQTLPASYSRLVFQPRIDLGILPLYGSLFLTTEQFSVSHPIHNFSLSFDYLTFTDRLRKQVAAKKKYDDSIMGADTNLLKYGQLKSRYNELSLQMKNPRYTKQLEKDKRILALSSKDTLATNKDLNLQNAQLRLKQHELHMQEMKKIEDMLPSLEAYSRDKRVTQEGKSLESGGLKSDMKKYGLNSSRINHLLAIKRFDIGNTSPDYSELTIKGLSINGINVEYNPGKFYTAFAYGKTVNQFANPFGNSFREGRKILAARLGYGEKEGSLICATVMKGWDGNDSYVNDSNFVYYEPKENTVVSLYGKWKWKEHLQLESEYAGSINTARNSTAEKNDLIEKPKGLTGMFSQAFSQKGHQAFNVKASSTIKESGTELMLAYRNVQGQYYSFGNPFLRPDNKRTEGKVVQGFFKKQVSLTGSFRRDEDNILSQKQFSTITNLYNYTADFHFRNTPFLVVSYAPSLQHYKGTDANNYVSKTRVYSVSTGYTCKIRTSFYTLTLLYSNQSFDSRFFNSKYAVQMYSVAPQVQFKNGLQVFGNGTLTQANGNDSMQVKQASAGAAFIFKNKMRLTGSLFFTEDKVIQSRTGLQTGWGMPLGKKGRIDLTGEYHWIDEYRKATSNSTQMIWRLKLTKNF